MPHPTSIYVHCDELENIPAINRENWNRETEITVRELKPGASVLQIGCMNAKRLIAIQRQRPDLRLTGIDIEPAFLEMARANIADASMQIETKLCDITSKEQCEKLGHFDYVFCLNNTLGYISEESRALENMFALAPIVIVSVYGEQCTNERMKAYLESINLKPKEIDGNLFHCEDFTTIKRYTKEDVEQWNGRIIETPLGYFCMMGVVA